MKSNWLSHAGTHTSACGVTAYRGGLFGEHSNDQVFVCEPVGHLVTRSVIQPDGAGLTAVRGREQHDFLTSTDTWFRPASLATGPNGELYLADMYRLWVEHPKFVPEDVAKKMNWRAGEDRGRIWCITPDSHFNIPATFTAPQTDDDLLRLLTDTNGWRRMLAQRLIVDAGRTDLEPRLRRLLLHSSTDSHTPSSPLGRLHALWCLHGLQKLTPQTSSQPPPMNSMSSVAMPQNCSTNSSLLPPQMSIPPNFSRSLPRSQLIAHPRWPSQHCCDCRNPHPVQSPPCRLLR
ncbi:MAG UNVERIFIED_CONTAM: hypothetical protein LVR18_04100 [Planctomycetaceae bacterium]|jgi:hypothetical protein